MLESKKECTWNGEVNSLLLIINQMLSEVAVVDCRFTSEVYQNTIRLKLTRGSA